MPHVGVERLAAGDRQEHAAAHQQGQARVADEQAQSVSRVQRQQDLEVIKDVDDPHECQKGEPYGRNGSEEFADAGRALVLENEKHGEDRECQRKDETLQAAVDDGKPFDGRQHRHGWA